MSKKFIKKSVSLLLAIVTILMCFSIIGFAWSYEYSDNDILLAYDDAEDFSWSFDEDTGTLHIYGNGAMPEAMGCYSNDYMDAFVNEWYIYYDKITKLIVHEGITVISEGAFNGLINLKEVELPDTLECIDGWAFTYCFSLENIDFPKNLKYILGEATFYYTSLKSIILPESIIYCAEHVFELCYFAEKIVLPKSINEYGLCVYSPYIKTITNKSMTNHFQVGYANVLPQEDPELAKKFAQLYMLEVKLQFGTFIKDGDYKPTFVEEASDVLGINFDTYSDVYSYINSFSADKDSELYNNYTVYCYENSAQHLYCEENGIPYIFINDNEPIEAVTVTDESTGVIAEYTSDIFDGMPEMIITEGGKNANIAFNGKFGKYTSYDIYFEIDGEKVQPNGKVMIKIPIPEDYNSNSVKVFFIDDKGNKEKLDSICENGYIIFETDHFSEYAIVDESSEITDEPTTEPDEPVTPEEPDDLDCTCNCHKSGFMGFIWKILRIFYKLFGTNKVCGCGVAHY